MKQDPMEQFKEKLHQYQVMKECDQENEWLNQYKKSLKETVKPPKPLWLKIWGWICKIAIKYYWK
jgi:hypothetical protein